MRKKVFFKKVFAVILVLALICPMAYKDVKANGDGVARIGEQYYSTLADAFTAAPTDGTETEIVLLSDVELTAEISLTSGQNIVLTDDGIKRTISRGSSFTEGSFFFVVSSSSLKLQGSSKSDDNVTLVLDGNSVSCGNTNSCLVDIGTKTSYANAIFTMEKGVSLQNNLVKYCGGVRVFGTFVMNGGFIQSNSSYISSSVCDNGGGVAIKAQGSMTITGGTIQGNRAKNGAGIHIDGSNTNAIAFKMTGGTITGNTATNYAGAITAQSQTVITGGTIVGNTAGTAGTSGIRLSNKNLELGGTAVVDSIWLVDSMVIDVTSPLTMAEDASITVGRANGYDVGTNILTGNAVADSYQKFTMYTTTVKVDETGALVSAGGSEVVKDVAQIGDVSYTSLKDAFAAVPTDGTVTTIVLLSDILMTVDDNISLLEGQKVVLTDDGTTRTITRENGNTGNRLITIVKNSELTLEGTGTDNSPTLIFDGAGIGGNAGQLIAVYTANQLDTDAVLTMKSGVVLQNNSSNFGGAVLVHGTFNMEGGLITKNKSTGNGGGIALHHSGIMNMSGGAITYNTAATNGGAIHINNSEDFVRTTAFEMTDGSITHNSATGYGGAITVQGKTIITGGRIEDNTAAGYANGLRVSNFDLTIGGAAKIDEIWLHSDGSHQINIATALTVADEKSILVERSDGAIDAYTVGFQLLTGDGVAGSYDRFTLPAEVEDVYIGRSGSLVSTSITDDINGAKIEFRGGSLRMDYKDYDKTSLRFGYKVTLPEGATLTSWSYTYTTIDPDKILSTQGINKVVEDDGTIYANLVVTGIPREYYTSIFTAKMKIEYRLPDGTACTLEEDVRRERSVNIVANKILASDAATRTEIDYATNILK